MSLETFKLCEIEVMYRPKIKASQRPKVKSSKDAYTILRSSWDENKINLVEEAKILLLNRGHKVLGISPISQGGLAGTVVDQKVIFALALKSAASAIVLAHNHPSGNTNPSEEDKKLTKKLVSSAKILDINMLDHLIVTDDTYYSFADDGLIY